MQPLPTDLEIPTEPTTSKSVTIEQQPDGSYLVGTDSDMNAEGMGEPQEDAGMQPAATIDEALALARQMLQDDGTQGPMRAMRADVAKETWPAPKPPMGTMQ